MKNKNTKIKIHFIGIGGIGMSGIAELMHKIGYSVFGSDFNYSENIKRLREIGIIIKIGTATGPESRGTAVDHGLSMIFTTTMNTKRFISIMG